MPINILVRFSNMALRGLTLISKFLLIFFLARFLEPSELGLYGLLVVTIGYSLYLLGLDFYTFSTREIIKHDRSEWGGLLKNQGALTLILYALFIPLLLFIFSTEALPWSIAHWFFLLLILEHVNQELMRLLIAISEQLLASLVLFFRSGVWALVITALMFIEPDARNLNAVLAAWAIGGICACLLAGFRLCQLQMGGWRKRIDWAWIRNGIRIALPLLIATFALRGLFTLDRYWFESLAGLDALGAYVLFIGIANAMMSFLDAGVFAFIYPALIGAFQRQEEKAFRSGMKKLFIQTLGLSLTFVAVALLMINPLLHWLDRPIYIEQQGLFPWILLASFLYALGMVPHYALYAQRKDRPIIHSHIASLVLFISATWLFSFHWSSFAVPLGLCAAFLLILIWKLIAFFRLTPANYRSRIDANLYSH